MQHVLLRKPLFAVFFIMLLSGRAMAQFEEGLSSVQLGSIDCSNTTLPNMVFYTSQGEASRTIKNILRFKINELATTGSGSTPPLQYYKSGFTATATITVDLWASAAARTGSPDQTLTKTLTVNYDPAAGAKYTPVAYVVLSDAISYEAMQVTVNSVPVTGTANGWTSADVLPLLTVENEMQILRYFTLSNNPSLLAPAFTSAYDATNHSDQLSVSWTFPAGVNNNLSQLEYAWVENETKGFYTVGGVFDSSGLFNMNSTRIDIDYSSNSYNIPLLYDADPAQGGGTLYFRVRPVQRKNDGNLIVGPWSTAQTFSLTGGHQPNMNWQSTTDFAENGKSKTVIQYFDGTLRPRQTVTKDNSTGNTIVAETIYDLQGRPNVQILPTPTLSTAIQYFSDFNRFSGQSTNDNPAKYFDLSVAGTQCNGSPALDSTHGNGQYYSSNNPWIGVENTASFIPGAAGFGYSETRYTDDPTGRVSIQGGVGKAFQVGNGHETKYFYGKPTQNELDALFGTEAGDATHYFKNMVQDPNGQMSVSYVDMHGRTVATALAGQNPAKLSNINNNSTFYPVSSGLLTNNLLTPAGNVIKGDSIESLSTLLLPSNTTYNFTYQLNPAIFQQLNGSGQSVCFDCKYNLEISVRQEDCSDAAPIVKHFNNLQIVAADQACTTSMGFVGDGITTPTTTISFSIPLTTGSWIVRKTLSINDSLFRIREDSALNSFLSKTQKNLSDSVFSAMSAATSCSVNAATRNCASCQAQLGSYATYKTTYLASLGGVSTLSDAAIHALYTQDSLDCADACGLALNPAMSTLGQLRTQLLNDMIPYTGQYALPTDSIPDLSKLQAKYNIFVTSYTGSFGSFGTKPFYENPVTEPSGTATFYTNGDGTPDNTLYPGGISTDHSHLNTITTDTFATIFNRNWAGQLIFYHPEYSKLHYAETTLQTSYAWLDQVQQCDTYANALSNGYLSPLTSDPYFTFGGNTGYVPGDRTNMATYLTTRVPTNDTVHYSIWLLANGLALCDSTQPQVERQNCMMGMSSTGIDPSATTTAQKDAVWKTFRALYLGYRNEMVVNYINVQQAGTLSSSAMTELQTEGKQLRFTNAQGLADQNKWTWWSTATDLSTVDPVGLAGMTNTYVMANSIDQCTAERPFWQARLMQCEQLQQFLLNQTHSDSVKVDTIINAILDSMVMVCHNSIDARDPAGASNVNPSLLPVAPANFEDIINHVFSQYGLATLPGNNYFCNPYSIDYPKPYNSNPPLFVNSRASVDTCNCQQFSSLKVAAKAAGFDSTSMSSMNTYLLANYNDTVSLTLWQGLQHCNGNHWSYDTCYPHDINLGKGVPDSCVSFFKPISLGAVSVIPAFLSCGYVQPCVTCSLLQSYTATFRVLYPAYAGVPYTSGATSVDTGMAKQNALWARYLNYRTGFSKTANEYAAAFLSCGLDPDAADLVLTDRIAQPPSGSAPPYLYSATSSITVSTGFTSLAGDDFETRIAAMIGSSGNALCALDQPVTFITMPDTANKNPCQQVQDQANFIAMRLFRQLQDSLTANFDSLYRAKCLGAQSMEVFYATYTPSEYHYTLYYYDQAGNLLKTIPPAAVRPNFDPTYLASVQTDRASASDLGNGTNIENMATQYRYNTLNQVVAQRTPDAGVSHFWYDRLGRLAVSQNAKQAGDPSYSYTLYDLLGRITEVGQKPQTTAMTQTISQDDAALQSWISDLSSGGTKQQITRTVYDVAYPGFSGPAPIYQINLRNRVAYTQVLDADNTDPTPYRAATFYSYDIHGNVDSLLQDYGASGVMNPNGNRFKLIKYDYDLISGKVNQVSYQPGQADGFYHQYSYDAENRITGVRTSTDSVEWQDDAQYTYYRHGPLARVQLGSLQVQGMDYAYTLQGWLKSVNPSWITPSGLTDQYDGDGTSTVALLERDAYKFNLQYYDNGTYTDYTPVAPPSGYAQGSGIPSAQRRNLYNGNISTMGVNIRPLASGTSAYAGPLLYNYAYDQLNRIDSMDVWAANGSFAATGTSPMTDFAERFGYDPNGNILSLSRNGTTGNGGLLAMDNLSYKYLYAKSGGGVGEYVPGQTLPGGIDHLTDQLSSIQDGVSSSNYTTDIDNQSAFNYQYDAIGNLTADVQAGITGVTWNVYGKILSITNSSGTITYTYDASGNRISKTVGDITTWYVRDATGNVMSVYTAGDGSKNSGALTQSEAHVYGSSRLGILNLNVNCTSLTQPVLRSLVRGNKLFELPNHLGNVLVTISDKKLQHSTDGSTVDYYTADAISANDYYAFGSPMPGRTLNTEEYRYGFNGKEKDDEVKGSGNQYDYGFRIYDPRIGRFLSVDPLFKGFPYYTPYQFAGNMPIWAIDLDGLEEMKANSVAHVIKDIKGNIVTKPTVVNDLEPSIDNISGVRRLNGSQIEVTPGLVGQNNPTFNTLTWQQVNGKDFIIQQSNTPIGQDAGGTVPPKTNLQQDNDGGRTKDNTGTTPVITPINHVDVQNQTLTRNINFVSGQPDFATGADKDMVDQVAGNAPNRTATGKPVTTTNGNTTTTTQTTRQVRSIITVDLKTDRHDPNLQTNRYNLIRQQLINNGVPAKNIRRGTTQYDQTQDSMGGRSNQTIFRVRTTRSTSTTGTNTTTQ